MRKHYSILFFIILNLSFSQGVEVKYNVYFNPNLPPTKALLTHEMGKSLFTFFFTTVIEDEYTTEDSEKKHSSIITTSSPDENYYKNASKNIIKSNELVLGKMFYLKDTTAIFRWKTENEFKEILGFKCQKATSEFRGRMYEVYFTAEIPINDGPWKLYGLPGIILEAKSDDDYIKFEAYSFSNDLKEKTRLDSVFAENKLLDYPTFRKKVRSVYENTIKNNKSRNDGEYSGYLKVEMIEKNLFGDINEELDNEFKEYLKE